MKQQSDINQQLRQALMPALYAGFAVVSLVLIFFGIWAGFAPIDSAAIAHGEVILSAHRKTVQHLEGGIIKQLLVKEGDIVKAQQPLLYLNATSAASQQQLLEGQLHTAQATIDRLQAERDGKHTIQFRQALLAQRHDPEVKALLDSQTRLFKSKQAALSGQIDILHQRIAQFEEQIKGLKAQTVQTDKRIALIVDEATTTAYLLKEGLEEKPHLLALQRKEAELTAQAAQQTAQIATIKDNISETRLQIINAKDEYLKEVMTEYKETQQQLADLREKMQAASDILQRTVIVAPQAGKVTGLKYYTVGGVITPGSPIMDIVPQNDKLLIEAHVRPQDIDIVHEGLPAKVMLSAYKSRFVPRLAGDVVYVSADRFSDEKTGEAYYLARIAIHEQALAKLQQRVTLYPGMPAEVFITTGERTLLQYLASPIIDSFRRAFKEQ